MNVWHSVKVTFYEVRFKFNRSKLWPPFSDLWRNPTYSPPNRCLLSDLISSLINTLTCSVVKLFVTFFWQMIERIGFRYRLSLLHYPEVLFVILVVGSTVCMETFVPVLCHKLRKYFPELNEIQCSKTMPEPLAGSDMEYGNWKKCIFFCL
jgi:hypothetical protein